MKTVKGDLITKFLKGEFDVLIHGCNCFRAMASGIAGQIVKRIPEAQFADNMYMGEGDFEKLSTYSTACVRRENGTVGVVINLYTQFKPGSDLYEDALTLGFKRIANTIHKNIKIGIPLIGCGVAGGDWKIVKPKITKIMENHNVTVVEYEQEGVLD
tara:strand:+ start:8261 stop:8731 length:471 start_codon:yes stop_codon:yes gene_type:complete